MKANKNYKFSDKIKKSAKSPVEQSIHEVFRRHRMQVSHRQLSLFSTFYECLKSANRELNLTRIYSLEGIVVKHFIDSMMVRRLAWFPSELTDMGSGAGFPGIPLRIMDPNLKLTLVEPVKKRVEFLKWVREELHLNDIRIIGKKLGPNFQYPTKGIVTRAFKSVNETLEAAQYSMKPGGRIYLMKGPGVAADLQNISLKMKALYTLVNDTEYRLPLTTHVRRLIVFERNGTCQDSP
jgi:16S rRNA (guanine527-N7)-methyltransferase